MATYGVKSGRIEDAAPRSARVMPEDGEVPVSDLQKPKDELAELTSWIVSRVRMWRDHRRTNYDHAWDVYERLWRGMWTSEDQNKKSERSTLVTPGLAEAVENIVAEVEEALWGRGDSFDLTAKFGADENARKEVDENKAKLKEDLDRGDFNPNVGEALINAAVYGSGIGEILVETFMLREIAASVRAAYPPMGGNPVDPLASMLTQGAPGVPTGAEAAPMGDFGAGAAPMAPAGMLMGAGSPLMGAMQPQSAASMTAEARVIEREVQYACLQSVNPRNFVIEPTARTIDKALGCAVEEYVGAHIIRQGQAKGDYRAVEVGTSAGDQELIADRQAESEYTPDKVHVIRYYGLVPKHLLFPPGETVDLSAPESEGEALGLELRAAEAAAEEMEPAREELVDIMEGDAPSTEPIDAEMVEAVVIIANESVCLKAIENPYLMKDRPIVAFPWDVVPGRFWGRGVCEKGQVPQRVMDAEIRARIDALAYVSAPMMGMDASRLPRGFQFKVRPGKSILTNGKPSDVLHPMHFGQLDQSTFAHSQQLDQMIQRATGSLDVIALASKAGGSGGDQRSGATSMMLSGIVKRHKRTLMSFVDRFYKPSLRKILWRNMQYYPERYTPRNWDFVATGTMGIIQREYETQNLVQLMNTMEPQSAEYKMMLMGVIANTGLTHRNEMIAMLKRSIAAAQQAQELQQGMAANPELTALQTQLQQATIQLQVAETRAKVRELESRANLQDAKARNELLEPGFRQAEIATKGIYEIQGAQQDRAIDFRMRMVDAALKKRDIDSNERIAGLQSAASVASERIKAGAATRGAALAKAREVKVPQPIKIPEPIVIPARGARLTA